MFGLVVTKKGVDYAPIVRDSWDLLVSEVRARAMQAGVEIAYRPMLTESDACLVVEATCGCEFGDVLVGSVDEPFGANESVVWRFIELCVAEWECAQARRVWVDSLAREVGSGVSMAVLGRRFGYSRQRIQQFVSAGK